MLKHEKVTVLFLLNDCVQTAVIH